MLSKQIIIILSIIALFVASKGFKYFISIFVSRSLFCCAAVLSIFYGFYSKTFSEKNAYVSIIIGLLAGLLLFPSPDFSKSILIGIIFFHLSKINQIFIPKFYLSIFVIFINFIVATFVPLLIRK